MLNRKLAGLAAGALGAGAVIVPAMTGVANAAATDLDLGTNLVCSTQYESYKIATTLTEDLALSVDGTQVTIGAGEFSKFQNVTDPAAPKDFGDVWFGPPMGEANVTFRVEDVTATAKLNIDGEAVTATSTKDVAVGAGTATTSPVSFAAFSGTRFLDKAPESVKVTDLDVTMELRVKSKGAEGDGTLIPMTFDCEGDTEQHGDAVDLVTAPEGGALYQCTIPAFNNAKMLFPATFTASAQAKGSNVVGTVQMNDLAIKTIPVALENTPITATMKGKVDGKAATFTGTRSVTVAARNDIPLPAISGSVASTSKSVDVEIGDIAILAKHSMMDVEVNCDIVAPAVAAAVAVADEVIVTPPNNGNNPGTNPGTGVTNPVVKAKATKSKITSVKVKNKKATVKASVKAGKKNVAGKATIVVKNAKGRTVAKKTVTLKKGAATYKTKKLKAGKYKATVTFKGTKTYKKSTSKAKSFRVKK